MRQLFLLSLVCAASPAHAWESFTAQVGVVGAFSSGHRPHVGLEVGGSYAFGLETVSPSAGVRGRLLFDREGPVLPQLAAVGGVTVGPLTPLVAAQVELGVVWAGQATRPSYGASMWSAPASGLSPYLGASWTRFSLDDSAQDLFQLTAGAALVAPVIEILLLAEPSCVADCG